MKRSIFVYGFVYLLCVAPLHGATISIVYPQQDAMLGVKVNPTGPRFARVAPTLLEELGNASGMFSAKTIARDYSASAVFKKPLGSVTMTIENLAPANRNNDFTLVAFYKHRRVARETVALQPAGDETQITLLAPSIDKIKWFGEGWKLHPYVVMSANANYAGAVNPNPTPQVSASAPEPAFIVIGGPFAIFLLLTRRRRTMFGK